MAFWNAVRVRAFVPGIPSRDIECRLIRLSLRRCCCAVSSSGYTTPTPIQAEAIPPMLAGRDVMGCAQTGTGKTAAFALPILHHLTNKGNPARGSGRRIRALVLSPTRELASQIRDSFQTYGRETSLRYTVIFGGVGQHPQVKALRNGVDVVVATPGRLLDLMNQGHVDLRAVEIFVLDEADRMLDMGFLPDLRRVIAKLPSVRQTVFFSATMPAPIEQLADSICATRCAFASRSKRRRT